MGGFRSGQPRNWGRRRTYERLSEVAFAAGMQVDLAFIVRAEWLLERLERPPRRKEFWR
jgi:hypothetical protein